MGKPFALLLLCCMGSFLVIADRPSAQAAKADQPCDDTSLLPVAVRQDVRENGDVWSLDGCDAVRHRQSGTVCKASIGFDWPLDRLIIFPSEPTIARGEDVACDYLIPDGGAYTLYLTHFDRPYTDPQMFEGIKNAILSRFPEAKPLNSFAMTSETLHPFTALYEIETDGVKYHTGVWYQTVNGWQVKVRVTYPATPTSQAEENQVLTSLQWLSTAMKLEGRANR